HRLGIRDIFPVSAEHGRGVDELLDAVIAELKARKILTTEARGATEELATTEEGQVNSTLKSKSPPSRRGRGKGGAPSNSFSTNDQSPTADDDFAHDARHATHDDFA